MPDIYTHILNGRETIKKLDSCDKKIMESTINVFYLGCMGPDIFLYHNFYPWRKYKAVRGLGENMHNDHCGELILEALKYIRSTTGVNEDLDIRSIYILGYICHYGADRTAHPFIFSRSGLYDKSRPETYKYKNSHKVMELAIDFHLAKKLDDDNINHIRMDNFINIGDYMPQQLIDLYKHLFGIYFKEYASKLGSNFINESYRDIKKAWKLFYDPAFIKRHIFGIIGYDSFFYPLDPYRRDYMNEKKTPWSHPCDSDVLSNKTFYEIFNESVGLSANMLNISLSFLKGRIDIEPVEKAIGNYSFTTNMDVNSICKEMKYFTPVF